MKPATLGLFLMLVFQGTHCQEAASLPRPGPEIQKLAYYLGTWKGEGEAKPGPFGAAGKLSSMTTCDWFDGGFQLVCHGEENGPSGKRSFLNIRGYDQKSASYVEYGISSLGDGEYATGGTIEGNKKTFVVDIDAGDKPAKVRYVEEMLSSTLFTYRAEVSVDGGPWEMIAEGKVSKIR